MLLRTLGISLTVLIQGTMQIFDSHEFMSLFKQPIESYLDEDMQHISRFHFKYPGSFTRELLNFNCSISMQLYFDAGTNYAALIEMIHNTNIFCLKTALFAIIPCYLASID
jgi:hypothetical protein